MTRKNKRALARAARYINDRVEFANDILDDEEDRLDCWAENLKGSQKHMDAEDFVEDVREQFDIITDAVEEIRSLCGIED